MCFVLTSESYSVVVSSVLIMFPKYLFPLIHTATPGEEGELLNNFLSLDKLLCCIFNPFVMGVLMLDQPKAGAEPCSNFTALSSANDPHCPSCVSGNSDSGLLWRIGYKNRCFGSTYREICL